MVSTSGTSAKVVASSRPNKLHPLRNVVVLVALNHYILVDDSLTHFKVTEEDLVDLNTVCKHLNIVRYCQGKVAFSKAFLCHKTQDAVKFFKKSVEILEMASHSSARGITLTLGIAYIELAKRVSPNDSELYVYYLQRASKHISNLPKSNKQEFLVDTIHAMRHVSVINCYELISGNKLHLSGLDCFHMLPINDRSDRKFSSALMKAQLLILDASEIECISMICVTGPPSNMVPGLRKTVMLVLRQNPSFRMRDAFLRKPKELYSAKIIRAFDSDFSEQDSRQALLVYDERVLQEPIRIIRVQRGNAGPSLEVQSPNMNGIFLQSFSLNAAKKSAKVHSIFSVVADLAEGHFSSDDLFGANAFGNQEDPEAAEAPIGISEIETLSDDDGLKIMCGYDNGVVSVIDLKSGIVKHRIRCHNSKIRHILTFSDDLMITCTDSIPITIWQLQHSPIVLTQCILESNLEEKNEDIKDVKGDDNDSDSEEDKKEDKYKFRITCCDAQFFHGLILVVCGTDTGCLLHWWYCNQEETVGYVCKEKHRGRVTSIAIADNLAGGCTIASCSLDGTVRYWLARATTMVCLRILHHPDNLSYTAGKKVPKKVTDKESGFLDSLTRLQSSSKKKLRRSFRSRSSSGSSTSNDEMETKIGDDTVFEYVTIDSSNNISLWAFSSEMAMLQESEAHAQPAAVNEAEVCHLS